MLQECEKIAKLQGEIEIDESYFGAKRVRGKRGRGAGRKTPVFGMLKREGKVYTQVVKNCSVSALIPILEAHSNLQDSTIFSDTWRAYDGLVDYGSSSSLSSKDYRNTLAKTSLQKARII